ncbi:MAG TPA: MXAN_5187 C-terminal domain-containing protein [Polyangiaceae bacterium]|nr:MXAN_5187 C-terminal domain-containing protein [Polyangiaceae bacterium]
MTPEEFDHELDELEIRVERLRALYEQYFLGIEKIEPGVARKDVDRRFWAMKKIKVRNTAKRFKLQVLTQRYNTLQQYWTKVCRQIENGTYVRHLVRARRRAEAKAAEAAAPTQHQSSAPPRPSYIVPRPDSFNPPKPRSEPAAKAPLALGEARVEELHRQLAAAYAQARPGEKPISKKALAESLRVTEARLREKHNDKQIDFQVVVRDGQVTIKPVLRRGS